jgi:hypothetical protein
LTKKLMAPDNQIMTLEEYKLILKFLPGTKHVNS